MRRTGERYDGIKDEATEDRELLPYSTRLLSGVTELASEKRRQLEGMPRPSSMLDYYIAIEERIASEIARRRKDAVKGRAA